MKIFAITSVQSVQSVQSTAELLNESLKSLFRQQLTSDAGRQLRVALADDFGPGVDGLPGGVVPQQAHLQEGEAALFNQVLPVVVQNISIGVVGIQALELEPRCPQLHRQAHFALFDQVPFARPVLQRLPEVAKGLALQSLGLVSDEG